MAFYIGLLDSLGREVRGAGYSRQEIRLDLTDEGVTNLNEIHFPIATESWGAVAVLRIYEGEETLFDVPIACPLDPDRSKDFIGDTYHVKSGESLVIPGNTITMYDQRTVYDHLLEED